MLARQICSHIVILAAQLFEHRDLFVQFAPDIAARAQTLDREWHRQIEYQQHVRQHRSVAARQLGNQLRARTGKQGAMPSPSSNSDDGIPVCSAWSAAQCTISS